MNKERLILNKDGKPFVVNPRTLLIFLDETGTETLNDNNAPFFGLGGLIIEADKYFEQVEIPWYKIKDQHYNRYDQHLHASELGLVSTDQINAFNQFFTNRTFGRFAVTCTDKSIFETAYKVENIVAACVWDRIKIVADKMNWQDIIFIYEENERLVPVFKQEIMSENLKNGDNEISIEYFLMKKDPTFAGMEVADFIIHTAGRQARIMQKHHFDKNRINQNPDFEQVFGKNKLQSYLSISKVKNK